MKRPENDKWLDDALAETIGSKKTVPNFEKWKQGHHQAVEMLTSRARLKASTIKRPHIIRNIIMKSPITKLAVAAVLIIVCFTGLFLWKSTGSGIALADVLARIEQVRAFRCQWSTKIIGMDPNKPYSLERRGTILASQEYGRKGKIEELDPDDGWSMYAEVYTFPEKKTKIIIKPKQKNYWRLELDDGMWEEQEKLDPRTLTKRILECKHQSLGRATIDSIEVEGFQTTDPNLLFYRLNKVEVDAKMWVDVKTRLPVRYDFTYSHFDQMGDKIIEHVHVVTHDFQWDVPVDAAEFEPVIPDDYTSLVVKYPAHITEETNIQGLKRLFELLGKYPENINDVDQTVLRLAEKSETPAALRLKEDIKGLTEDEITGNKLVDFLMPIRGLARFYNVQKDPAYYGKTVTPKNGDKVLMRWKVSDNEYRVIFGDLRAETVTAEALAELEKLFSK